MSTAKEINPFVLIYEDEFESITAMEVEGLGTMLKVESESALGVAMQFISNARIHEATKDGKVVGRSIVV